jgi:hypothetical protein
MHSLAHPFRPVAVSALLLVAMAGGQTTRGISSVDTIPLSALVGFETNPDQQRTLTQMQEDLFQELLKSRKWRLVDPARVASAIREGASQDAQACSTSCIRDLGSQLGVQTLLLPNLDRNEGISRLSVQEVDAASGAIIRSAQAETDESLPKSGRNLARLVVARLDGDPAAAPTDYGVIRVDANVPTAVWIDGEAVGESPLTWAAWPGVHRVSVEPDHPLPPDRDHPAYGPNFSFGAVFLFQTSGGGHGGHYGGYSQRPHPGGPYQRPVSGPGRSHRGGNGDGTGTIIAGTLVTALGIGMVAHAASMPDSIWSGTWQDVQVKVADTTSVEFRKESNGDKTAMNVFGILGIILGVVLIAGVLASKN